MMPLHSDTKSISSAGFYLASFCSTLANIRQCCGRLQCQKLQLHFTSAS
jgi:hypothetical protein